MHYCEGTYVDPGNTPPQRLGCFHVPVLEIPMGEIPYVRDILHTTGRDGLGDRVGRIAMMHELLAEGTDILPTPLVLEGEAARQIHTAEKLCADSRGPAEEYIVEIFTHHVLIDVHDGHIVAAAPVPPEKAPSPSFQRLHLAA
ncbi:hypothetical protein EYC59_03920 [Candidatus Saccharibacteria bacterium]|nr:MAG: hypothetical protein EYC59_03920 [Candidatus Saccharibacteria bacterium]